MRSAGDEAGMARAKTAPARVNERHRLAARLREIRVEVMGDTGGPEMARRLGVPPRSWYNYEIGVTVPAEVLLRFLDVTGADPRWLLTGEGERFRATSPPPAPQVAEATPTGPASAGPLTPAPISG